MSTSSLVRCCPYLLLQREINNLKHVALSKQMKTDLSGKPVTACVGDQTLLRNVALGGVCSVVLLQKSIGEVFLLQLFQSQTILIKEMKTI